MLSSICYDVFCASNWECMVFEWWPHIYQSGDKLKTIYINSLYRLCSFLCILMILKLKCKNNVFCNHLRNAAYMIINTIMIIIIPNWKTYAESYKVYSLGACSAMRCFQSLAPNKVYFDIITTSVPDIGLLEVQVQVLYWHIYIIKTQMTIDIAYKHTKCFGITEITWIIL